MTVRCEFESGWQTTARARMMLPRRRVRVGGGWVGWTLRKIILERARETPLFLAHLLWEQSRHMSWMILAAESRGVCVCVCVGGAVGRIWINKTSFIYSSTAFIHLWIALFLALGKSHQCFCCCSACLRVAHKPSCVVEPYQLWQVKDTRVKPEDKSVCVGLFCSQRAGSWAQVHESDGVGVLLCFEISWNGLPSGVCESMKQNVTV